MIRLLLAGLIVGFCYWAIQHARALPPQQRRKFWFKAGLFILAAAIVALTVTGKMHWVGALIAAAIPLAGKAINIGLRVLPFVKMRRPPSHTSNEKAKEEKVDMTCEQACEILGIEASAKRGEIIEAHRKIMQKVHPDRGGSDYLAAQVNQAKDLLLKELSS